MAFTHIAGGGGDGDGLAHHDFSGLHRAARGEGRRFFDRAEVHHQPGAQLGAAEVGASVRISEEDAVLANKIVARRHVVSFK